MATGADTAGPDGLLDRVEQRCRALHGEVELEFHGWEHIVFVCDHAVVLAARNGGDPALTRLAAHTHDLNYVARRNSPVEAGADLRAAVLRDCGADEDTVRRVEEIVTAADVRARPADAGPEVRALADADMLFKILPITPVLYAPAFLRENGVTLAELAERIVTEQGALLEAGTLFYDHDLYQQVQTWAVTNVGLWSAIRDALTSPGVRALADAADATRGRR